MIISLIWFPEVTILHAYSSQPFNPKLVIATQIYCGLHLKQMS